MLVTLSYRWKGKCLVCPLLGTEKSSSKGEAILEGDCAVLLVVLGAGFQSRFDRREHLLPLIYVVIDK